MSNTYKKKKRTTKLRGRSHTSRRQSERVVLRGILNGEADVDDVTFGPDKEGQLTIKEEE